MTVKRSYVVGGMAGGSGVTPTVLEEHGSGVGPAPIMKGQTVKDRTWPLQSYLAFGALPTAVPCARLHARMIVAEWGLPQLAEIVELIVSELTTNAVRASEGLTGSRYRGRWSP